VTKSKNSKSVGAEEIRTVSLVGVEMLRDSGERQETQYGPEERARDNTRNILTLYVFVATLAVLGVLSFAMPKPEISQIENRPLEKAPRFSAEALFNGSLTGDFSRYYSDTFPWRERMISVASDLKSRLGVSGPGDANVSIHYGVDTAGGQDDANTPDGDAKSAADSPSAIASPGAAGPQGPEPMPGISQLEGEGNAKAAS
jgi:hypothetical protein